MSTILYKTIFLILSILPFINGMDIKLSLGKKLETSGYYPLIITYKNFNYYITYNVESDKKIQKIIIKKSLNYYKDSVNQALTNFLKDVPKMVQNVLKDKIKDYALDLKIFQKFSEIHSKYSPF